jgi:5-oxoprolinase (ATP-hydrolysing)
VLLSALGLVACSQGTMNNVILGSSQFSYYETVGGGTGAGPGFAGCDAVHSHMTNTAITDPEVVERRLPVRVEQFAIRRGSGGRGSHAGGDGIARKFRFLAPLSLSLLTQRRNRGAPGGAGGADGAPGAQWIEPGTGRRQTLDANAEADVAAGDVLVLWTPGGGGWGAKKHEG